MGSRREGGKGIPVSYRLGFLSEPRLLIGILPWREKERASGDPPTPHPYRGTPLRYLRRSGLPAIFPARWKNPRSRGARRAGSDNPLIFTSNRGRRAACPRQTVGILDRTVYIVWGKVNQAFLVHFELSTLTKAVDT